VNGLKYLVEIASEVYKINENIKFLIAGSGKEKGVILNYAHEMGVINKNLFMMDPVAKKELPGLLSIANIVSSFTIPVDALKYNSANKFFDGLSAGKPVMINYGGWQKDLLEKTKSGIAIPPDEPLQAAEILHDFITNERKLAAYSASARKLARDQFSVTNLYKRFEKTVLAAV
jgi:glycosyltransferase involved in cell wall biosynthesis